jgi:3-oxoacyl-[acyl-carrier-protein] synthase II
MPDDLPDHQRVVITGIGMTAPNGNSLSEYREALLAGRSGVRDYEIRYVGATHAGVCEFDASRHQSKKDIRRGTRAGSVGIFAANEAVLDAGISWSEVDTSPNTGMSRPKTRSSN